MIGDLEGIERINGTIGVVNKLRGRFDEARGCYLRQYEIAERIGDHKGFTNALLCLGILHAEEGRMPQALECFEKRLGLERKSGDNAGTCYTLGNIGLLYRQMGETKKAIEYLEETISQCRATGHRALLAGYLHSLATIKAEEGATVEAKRMVEEAMGIATELGLSDNIFNCRVLISRLTAVEDKGKALIELDKLMEEAGSASRKAAVAYEVAMITHEKDDYQAALNLFEGLCAENPRIEWKRIVEELRQQLGKGK